MLIGEYFHSILTDVLLDKINENLNNYFLHQIFK